MGGSFSRLSQKGLWGPEIKQKLGPHLQGGSSGILKGSSDSAGPAPTVSSGVAGVRERKNRRSV